MALCGTAQCPTPRHGKFMPWYKRAQVKAEIDSPHLINFPRWHISFAGTKVSGCQENGRWLIRLSNDLHSCGRAREISIDTLYRQPPYYDTRLTHCNNMCGVWCRDNKLLGFHKNSAQHEHIIFFFTPSECCAVWCLDPMMLWCIIMQQNVMTRYDE